MLLLKCYCVTSCVRVYEFLTGVDTYYGYKHQLGFLSLCNDGHPMDSDVAVQLFNNQLFNCELWLLPCQADSTCFVYVNTVKKYVAIV